MGSEKLPKGPVSASSPAVAKRRGGAPGAVSPRGNVSPPRVTMEALLFYVPLFQSGDQAMNRLLEGDYSSPHEKNLLENVARLRKLATERIAHLAGPLITREINKLISGSHLKGREDLFDILHVAGINGLKKGLRRFSDKKINKSSTNYIFQWIVTYAKKELNVLEAPFGIAPSRFQKYKKISAVRKKLTAELSRDPSNDEVLEFFHSGKADVKSMNGRVNKPDGLFASNQSITLELVQEQYEFENNLNRIALLDPTDSFNSDVRLSQERTTPFGETMFGVFLSKHDFNDEAKAVLMSDLAVADMPSHLEAMVTGLTQQQYRALSSAWQELMRDIDGPFYVFLLDNVGNFDDVDMRRTISSIENYGQSVRSSRYEKLFLPGKNRKL